jgi:hypothetical protein
MYIIGGLGSVVLSYIYNLNKFHIGVIFLAGPLFGWLLARREKFYKPGKKGSDGNADHSNLFKILMIFYSILFIILLFQLFSSLSIYYFPLHYFLVVAGIATIISLQIVHTGELSRARMYTILLEIFFLSAAVCASFQFLFPGQNGNDSLYHTGFIGSILDTGQIHNFTGYYINYPIYHLVFAVSSLVFGTLGLKFVQVFIAFAQILCFAFIFLIGRKFFSTQSALLSTLIISLSPYLFVGRYTYYPNSFSAIFFILLIFFVLYFAVRTAGILLASVVLTTTLIITHPFTPIVFIVVLFILLGSLLFLQIETPTISYYWIAFTSAFTIVWLIKPIISIEEGFYMDIVYSLKNLIENIDQTSITQATLAPYAQWSEIFLTDLGFTLLMLLGIIGAFYIVSRSCDRPYRNQNIPSKTLCLSVVLLLLIPTPYVLAIVYPTSLPERWFIFVEIFASIFAGLALTGTFITRTKSFRVPSAILLSLLMFVLVFFLVSTPTVNPNNQIYAQNISSRVSLQESEITAGNFINSLQLSSVHANSKYIALSEKRLARSEDFINPHLPSSYNDGFMVTRNYDLEKGFTIPLYGSEGKLLDIISPDATFYNFTENTAGKVFENGEVRMYFAVQ